MEMQLLTSPLCRGCLRTPPPTVKQVGTLQAPLVLFRGDDLPFLFPAQSSPQMAHLCPGSQLSPSLLDSLMAVPGLFLTHQP